MPLHKQTPEVGRCGETPTLRGRWAKQGLFSKSERLAQGWIVYNGHSPTRGRTLLLVETPPHETGEDEESQADCQVRQNKRHETASLP